jgi:hypothetical protein
VLTWCRAVPCRAVPCCAVLCRAVPFCAVPCSAVLCCAVQCSADQVQCISGVVRIRRMTHKHTHTHIHPSIHPSITTLHERERMHRRCLYTSANVPKSHPCTAQDAAQDVSRKAGGTHTHTHTHTAGWHIHSFIRFVTDPTARHPGLRLLPVLKHPPAIVSEVENTLG